MYGGLFEYLKDKEQQIIDYIKSDPVLDLIKPKHIYDGVLSYLYRPAKRLRPSVLLMACGCFGGEEKEQRAIPAAVGVELFHTWTLVHDDIIDNDRLRRGGPTVHSLVCESGMKDMGLEAGKAVKYGTDIAVLAGDIQHGWSTGAFIDCALRMEVNPDIILQIIKYLETRTLTDLIYGETVDVQFGLTDGRSSLTDISEEKVVEMLRLKTGVLYEFAGLAGAMIGKDTADINDSSVEAVKNFTGKCGIAFQLQDDILGILGDEKVLGKSAGSDIREGKKTTILLEALKNAGDKQREIILNALGNPECTAEELQKVKTLFIELNGIDHTRKLALGYISEALPQLEKIGDSYYRSLLYEWADYMVNRDF